VLRDAARYAAAMEAGRGARARAEQAHQEVADKRTENQELAAQNRALTASIEALSAAMADMAAFRKETAVVLGTRLSGTQATNEQLRRELEIMRADLDKKTQELEAIQSERGRLERTLLRLTGRR
jgi:predicted nuclease with TOPRIM domain